MRLGTSPSEHALGSEGAVSSALITGQYHNYGGLGGPVDMKVHCSVNHVCSGSRCDFRFSAEVNVSSNDDYESLSTGGNSMCSIAVCLSVQCAGPMFYATAESAVYAHCMQVMPCAMLCLCSFCECFKVK
jgi:hypothetical protein